METPMARPFSTDHLIVISFQPPPAAFRSPSQRAFLPATPRLKSQGNSVKVLTFFFYQVPPLQMPLWQGREEPVKALRFASTADAALARP